MDRVDYQTLIIQDLINLHKADEIDLSPWYQRRSVWNPAQKSYLINTLFEQKPIPALYVRHSLDLERSKSIKEIVDGQQRTRTILSYCKNDFTAKHPNHPKKVHFSKLSKEEQQRFLLTSVPIGYLLGASDADVIDIFGRINSISKSLNEQEKRNAAFSGEMKQFCLRQSSSRLNFWRNYNIFSANDISRMGEVQFTSDLVLNLINGLSDYSSKSINDLYKIYDDQFDNADEIAERLDFIFDALARLPKDKIADTIFSRSPIFFSLCMVIDAIKVRDTIKIERAISEIDEIFNSDDNKSEEDVEFYNACAATTQRINQRRTRHNYISSFF
jgi:hypothetical protein